MSGHAGRPLRFVARGAVVETLAVLSVAILAAALAALPEWRRPGFYFHDDMQLQYVPAMVEIGRAARSGHLALLSSSSWYGGALAGEYQHGVFSLFHVLLCACVAGLALSQLAAVVSVVYLALAGAGAYLASREFGLERPLAIATALVAALNGFNVIWGSWLPALTGWAWLMWFWWSVERLCRRAGWRWSDVTLVALTTYSVLVSGWHFADLLLPAVVAAVLARGAGTRTLMPRAFGLVVALGLGACLALPAVLCFVEYAAVAARSDFDQRSWTWTVPWQALKGLVLPLSTARWSAFYGEATESNLPLAGGVIPLLVALTALVAPQGVRRRKFAPLLVASGAVLVWTMLPSLSRVRWPFRWLPVFHLLVALAAARLLSLQRRARAEARESARARISRAVLTAAVGIGLIACAFVASEFEFSAVDGAVAAVIGVLVLAFAAFKGWDPATPFCCAVALNLLVAPLGVTERLATPTWLGLERCTSEWRRADRSRRYLGVYMEPDIVNFADPSAGHAACVLPGNSGMVTGLTFVNGYSTIFVAGLRRTFGVGVHGDLDARGIAAVVGPFSKPGGLLERWGIDRLVVPVDPIVSSLVPRLRAAGFEPAEDMHGAWIWRKGGDSAPRPSLESIGRASVVEGSLPAGALAASDPTLWHYVRPSSERGAGLDFRPRSTLSFAPVSLESELEREDVVEARVSTVLATNAAPALVLLRRPYLPGYRAWLDGQPLEVGRLDDALIGVVIPSGRGGRLRIAYEPLGLRLPASMGVIAAGLVLAAGLGSELVRRRRARGSTPVTDATSDHRFSER